MGHYRSVGVMTHYSINGAQASDSKISPQITARLKTTFYVP